MENTGFEVRNVRFTDTIAYPLSGGWHGHCFVPGSVTIESLLFRIDSFATWGANMLKLGRHVWFRTLIIADKK